MRDTNSEKPVTLSYEPAPGGGTLVKVHTSHEATEDDLRRALSAYPDGVESAVETFRQMRAKHPPRAEP
jgi:hypothetical protein